MAVAEKKICQNCKNEFLIEPDDFTFYEKMQVPPPTWCPECRMIRRFMFRNGHNLFRRKDAATGKEIFSGIPAKAPLRTYSTDYWNSDAWDPVAYGRECDFNRPFFDQFRELMYAVPWPAKSVLRMVNSDYSDNAGGFKNCYLCFNGDDFENCGYVVTGNLAKDSFDLYEARHTELSYEGYMVDECFKAFYSVNCEECTDVWFSRNLYGCTNCFGCVNLRKKSYHIFNQPYSREAYNEFMAQFRSGSHAAIQEMQAKAQARWLQFPMKYALLINVTNATGEHIERAKNIKCGYAIHEGENLAYSQTLGPPVSDSYDYTVWGASASEMYEALTCGEEVSRIRFSWECWPGSRDIEYSVHCRSSSNLFGCVGLKKKQYCILNKQYSKDDYFKLRNRIIEHMNSMPYVVTRDTGQETWKIVYKYGEFFPPEFSPFAYNETIAQDFFALSEVEAKSKGFLWREPERREYETTINGEDLPDDIKDVQDSILKEIIKCSDCGRAYRVIEMELAFLRRIILPIPRKCPECRFKDRFRFVNSPKFWHAKCQCAGTSSDMRHGTSDMVYTNAVPHFHGDAHCPNEFETSYAPGRPEIIYCEKCYQQEVA